MSNEILQVDDAALARERKAEPQTHRQPVGFSDHFAYGFTRLLRFCADTFFAKRYGHRAIVLETVAAVPGMVGATVTHLKCLRRMIGDEGWIRTLMEEAENERMHLMTFIEVAKPNLFERLVIMTVQWVFYVGFFLLYLVSSRTAHRVVGYFEEEAVVSYTLYLKEIDEGRADNVPAPAIARHYWQLPHDATLRDVVEVVRQDEQHHRDVNHGFADMLDGKTVDPDAHTPYPEHSASLAPEELPHALPYKSTPIFDEQSLPKALRQEHKTKAGVWGGVRVLEGKLQLEFGDGQPGLLVTPDNPGLLQPEQPHWVTPIGPMRMQVDFYQGRPNLRRELEI